MFTVYCTMVAAEVLLAPTNIESLLSVGGDLAMEYRCSCGERGRWRRGRGVPVKAPVVDLPVVDLPVAPAVEPPAVDARAS